MSAATALPKKFSWSNVRTLGKTPPPGAINVGSMLMKRPDAHREERRRRREARDKQDALEKTKHIQTTLSHLVTAETKKEKKEKKKAPVKQPETVEEIDAYVERLQKCWERFLEEAGVDGFNADAHWYDMVAIRARKPSKRQPISKRMKLGEGEASLLPLSVSAFEADIHEALDKAGSAGTPRDEKEEEEGGTKKKPRSSKPRRQRELRTVIERSIFFSLRSWSAAYRSAVELYCDNLCGSLPVFPRADEVDGAPAVYAKNGDCSLCRRKTTGFAGSGGSGASSSIHYAYYKCKCDKRRINHCLRCKIVEYTARARDRHGEFRIYESDVNPQAGDPDKVVGFKAIPCSKCNGSWTLSDLRLVGPPTKEQRQRVVKEREQRKIARAFRPRGDVRKEAEAGDKKKRKKKAPKA